MVMLRTQLGDPRDGTSPHAGHVMLPVTQVRGRLRGDIDPKVDLTIVLENAALRRAAKGTARRD